MQLAQERPQPPPQAEEQAEPQEEDTGSSDEAAGAPIALVDNVPFFSGQWPGTRNDWEGDVGIRILVEVPCVLTALGRLALNGLTESAIITLWRSDTQEEITQAVVGPDSYIEGHYAYENLEARIPLEVGVEYRVSQRCRGRMADKWFDGKATAQEVATLVADRYARFVGGCCRNDAGFPNRDDGERRRAGIVNFKVAREGLTVVPVSRQELARALAKAAADEENATPDTIDAALQVLSRLLAIFVDELSLPPAGASAAPPRAPALAIVATEEEFRGCARAEPLEAPRAGAEVLGTGTTVFQGRFTTAVADFARRYKGRLDDYGGPVEGAFVVSHRSGEVLAPAARLLKAGAGSSAREERLSAADIAALLPRGIAFARSKTGDITAFVSSEVRQGRVYRISKSREFTAEPSRTVRRLD